MPHKLRIEAKLKSALPLKHVKLTADFETVRGVTSELVLSIENVGDTDFPGGQIESIILEGIRSVHTVKDTGKIEALKPGAKTGTRKVTLALLEEGVAWLRISLSASDGQEVEHYEYGELSSDPDWSRPITILNRESVLILEAVNEVLEELKRRRG